MCVCPWDRQNGERVNLTSNSMPKSTLKASTLALQQENLPSGQTVVTGLLWCRVANSCLSRLVKNIGVRNRPSSFRTSGHLCRAIGKKIACRLWSAQRLFMWVVVLGSEGLNLNVCVEQRRVRKMSCQDISHAPSR